MPYKSPWPERDEELRAHWLARPSVPYVSRRMSLTPGQVSGRTLRLNLHFTPTGTGVMLAADHPAVRSARTLFPGKRDSEYRHDLLKSGYWQRKLGNRVTKGRWRGMRIFSLTLEERATCPRDCAVFRSCYGNGMQHSVRHAHGPQLEARLWDELTALAERNRRGFVVRLHILGDFYSVGYVEFWREALDAFPGLHVFGYTAWKPCTRIGAAVAALRGQLWSRFAVRTSGLQQALGAFVVDSEAEVPKGSVLCPAQTGKTETCGTCGVCWSTDKPIAFLRH